MTVEGSTILDAMATRLSARDAPSARLGWALALLLGFTILPLLWPRIPPLVDLPNHMSRFAIGAEFDRSPFFHQWFDFHWRLVGNLGVDLPATLLGRLIGVEPATKLVVIAIPLLAVAGMISLSLVIHRRLTFALPLAAMFAFNYAFNYGFVNFVMAAALTLLSLALWIHLDQRRAYVTRALIFVPLAFVVWLAHAVGWGILGVVIFGYELAAGRDAGKSFAAAGLHAALNCLILCAPLIPMLAWFGADGNAGSGIVYRPLRKIAYLLLALRNRNIVVDVLSTLVALSAIAFAACRRDFRFDRRLLYPGILLGLVSLALPDTLLGSGYTDLRVIPYAIILCLLAIAPSNETPLTHFFMKASFALFILRALYVTVTYAQLANHYDLELTALDHVPLGSKVYGFARVACFKDLWDDRLDHLHRIATVRRQAFTNSTWPPIASQTLSVHPDMIKDYVDLDSQRFHYERCRVYPFQSIDGSLAQVPRNLFNFYWLIGVPPTEWPRRDWLTPVWQSRDSVLYRIRRR